MAGEHSKRTGRATEGLALVLLASCAATTPVREEIPFGRHYRLVWSDEFDGDALDPAKWDHRAPGPRKGGVNVPDAVRLDGNGILEITTKRAGDAVHTGMIATQALVEFRYGYYEARMRLPDEPGHWAAFWLQSPTYGEPLGDPARAGVETDVIEYLPRPDRLDVAHHALHWDGYGDAHRSESERVEVPGLRDGWHVFGLEWTPFQYVFYVDGRETWRTAAAVSQRSQYLILSLEVGDWAGDIADAELPDSLLVDWVRVYASYQDPRRQLYTSRGRRDDTTFHRGPATTAPTGKR